MEMPVPQRILNKISLEVREQAEKREELRMERIVVAEQNLDLAIEELAVSNENLVELEVALVGGDVSVMPKVREVGSQRNIIKNNTIPLRKLELENVRRTVESERARENDQQEGQFKKLVNRYLDGQRREQNYEIIKGRIEKQKEEDRKREEYLEIAGAAWNREQKIIADRRERRAAEEEKRVRDYKKIELGERPKQIRKIVVNRGIQKLIHFSPAVNLANILKRGLLSRKELESKGLSFSWTDEERHDGWLNAISLSIEHKNDLMFTIKKSSQANWCILELAPEILWEKECAFFRGNAARNDLRRYRIDDLKKAIALDHLFDSSLRKPNCPPNCPDDVQAEVMVFEEIEPKYINKIFVNFSMARIDVQDIQSMGIEVATLNKQFKKNRADFYDSPS